MAKILMSGDWEYSVSSNKATIVGYYGKERIVDIPKTLDGIKVCFLNRKAFSEKEDVSEDVKKARKSVVAVFFHSQMALSESRKLPKDVVILYDGDKVEKEAYPHIDGLSILRINHTPDLVNPTIFNCADKAGITDDGFLWVKLRGHKQCAVIAAYYGKEKNINIPEKIENYPITKISEFVFAKSTIESVVFPDNKRSV